MPTPIPQGTHIDLTLLTASLTPVNFAGIVVWMNAAAAAGMTMSVRWDDGTTTGSGSVTPAPTT